MTPRSRLRVAGGGRRRPRQLEKVEQQHIVDLLRSIGGEAYVLGTRRGRGRSCPSCGTFVQEHQGTRQSPGLSDVIGFTPIREGRRRMLVVEVKAEGGRLRDEQRDFRDFCVAAAVPHVVGGLNAVIAWLMAEGFLKADQVPHYRLPAGSRTS